MNYKHQLPQGYKFPYRYTKDLRGIKLSGDDKVHIVMRADASEEGDAGVAKGHKLSRKSISSWRYLLKINGFLYGRGGRPEYVDQASGEAIVEKVKNDLYNKKAINVEKKKEIIREAMKQTALSRGIAVCPLPSKSFMNYTLKKFSIKQRPGQVTTSVRSEEEREIKTCISTLLLFKCMTKFVKNPNLLINFDATTIKLASKSNSAKKKLLVPVGYIGDNISTIPDSTDKQLDYTLKMYFVVNLVGILFNKYVFIMSDSRLSKEDFYFEEVEGLTNSTDMGKFGYVCWCNSKVGNKKFYDFFNKLILIPFVMELKALFGKEGANAPVGIMCDGEFEQIKLYFNKEIRDLFASQNVMIGKLSASSTAVAQALDAYKLFCNLHKYINTITDAEARLRAPLLAALNAAFLRYEVKNNKASNKKWQNDKGRAILLLIKTKIAADKVNTSQIHSSWEKVGIMQDLTVDENQVLHQFNCRISNHQFINLFDNLKEGMRLMEKNGEVKDSELTNLFECVKVNSTTKKVRDTHCIQQQRCVLLTNEDTLTREITKVEAKETAKEVKKNNLIIKQQNRAAKEAQILEKKIIREEKKRKRLEDAAASVALKRSKKAIPVD
jgi:hypothetical protein